MPLAAHIPALSISAGCIATTTTLSDALIAKPRRTGVQTWSCEHQWIVDMRVYLDDERPTPAGWQRVYWPDQAIDLLKTGGVTERSLDNDLGDDARGTGYEVLPWLKEAVATEGLDPPSVIAIHSANVSAREKMLAAVESIRRLAGRTRN